MRSFYPNALTWSTYFVRNTRTSSLIPHLTQDGVKPFRAEHRELQR
jgi:hypothetical protein